MIKGSFIMLLCVINCSIGICQGWGSNYLDSIKHELTIPTKPDTSRISTLVELANIYKLNKPDSSLYYGNEALQLARKIEFPNGQVLSMLYISIAQRTLGDITKSSQIIFKGLKLADRHSMMGLKGSLLAQLGLNYSYSGNYQKGLELYTKAKEIFDNKNLIHDGYHRQLSAWMEEAIGFAYFSLQQIDSANYYCQSSYKHSVELNASWVQYLCLNLFGKIAQSKKNFEGSLDYYRQSLPVAVDAHFFYLSYNDMAMVFRQMGNKDSSIYYAQRSLEVAKNGGILSDIGDASILLGDIYENHDAKKALEYRRMSIVFKDSLYNLGKKTGFENVLAYDEQQRQYEIETAQATYKNKVKQFVLIAGLVVLLLIMFLLFRNNRQKQKAKIKIEQAYENLKATQQQLIQSEKMASLGELTAGIAHEIQNPLNFVNNFSEVSTELLDEMITELQKNNPADAIAIADDVKQNLEKILHHGKRADGIVKGMLQHSSSSSGVKEPTDVNALADEYLRLAYHGLRAKDKSFNATMKTDFDESIGNINIIPQDIGRVILNLITNAFYAVSEKKKHSSDGYEPVVSVSTKKSKDKVEIKIKDNGNGIPPKVLDKIFQPFFTTKPTGQGTGLGLSLSYDIVKAHGGELKVETKGGEGAEFIIRLV